MAGGAGTGVYLNRWLHEQGHLRFQARLQDARKLKAKGAKAIASYPRTCRSEAYLIGPQPLSGSGYSVWP